MKWKQFLQKSLVHKILFNTVVYGSNESHIIMHNLKCKIGINWNFGNKLFLFISSDSCHKMILLESLTIPLNNLCIPKVHSNAIFPCKIIITSQINNIQNQLDVEIYDYNQMIQLDKKKKKKKKKKKYFFFFLLACCLKGSQKYTLSPTIKNKNLINLLCHKHDHDVGKSWISLEFSFRLLSDEQEVYRYKGHVLLKAPDSKNITDYCIDWITKHWHSKYETWQIYRVWKITNSSSEELNFCLAWKITRF